MTAGVALTLGCVACGRTPGVTKIYELGPFRLDSEAGVLTRAGPTAVLGSRGVPVLCALIERADE